MTNEELYQVALDAIQNLFSDKSVSTRECEKNLESLKDEIDMLLGAIEVDQANEKI